ncbi:hypothetical protein LWI28_007009 [Acer negundo]|uniref:Uncharacterized protein n=1 Tax=Acer negundo TaxID=4023 RepID=A0AAD5JRZ9_ACENE|nr:hypothetical protein LWI28_007009 [Acer negundo]
MKFWLTTLGLFSIIDAPSIPDSEEEPGRTHALKVQKEQDYLCHGKIFSRLEDNLFDIYYQTPSAHDLWYALEKKYNTEDAGLEKYHMDCSPKSCNLWRYLNHSTVFPFHEGTTFTHTESNNICKNFLSIKSDYFYLFSFKMLRLMKHKNPMNLYKEVFHKNLLRKPVNRGRLLGLDICDDHVALALSDTNLVFLSSSPKEWKLHGGDKLFSFAYNDDQDLISATAELKALIGEHKVEGLVVGYPFRNQEKSDDGFKTMMFINNLSDTLKFEGLKYTYWENTAFTPKGYLYSGTLLVGAAARLASQK